MACLAIAVCVTEAPPTHADMTIIERPVGAPGLPPLHLVMPPPPPPPRILQVGSARSIKLPSEAALIAQRGDIIEIDADS